VAAQNIKINLDQNQPAKETGKAAKPAASTAPAAAPASAAPAPADATKQEIIQPVDGKYNDEQKMQFYGYIVSERLNLAREISPLLNSEKELYSFLQGMGAQMMGGRLPYDHTILGPQMEELVKERALKAKAALDKLYDETLGRNTREATEFLAKIDAKAGVKKTASGLRYEVVQEGKGAKARADQAVMMTDSIAFINGGLLSSTKNKDGKDEPVEIVLADTIPALKEIVPQFGTGSKLKLYVPSEIGFGNKTQFPGALLIIDMEILEVKAPTKRPEPSKQPEAAK
jgi:FKBP-type peptidyl-prolyl cis-trans isomerase